MHKPRQAPQALLGSIEHVVVLADGEPQVILRQMGVLRGVELRGRDGGDAQLHDQEPGQLEVARALGHVRREVVAGGEAHARQVHEHEVAAFGVRVLFRGGALLVWCWGWGWGVGGEG